MEYFTNVKDFIYPWILFYYSGYLIISNICKIVWCSIYLCDLLTAQAKCNLILYLINLYLRNDSSAFYLDYIYISLKSPATVKYHLNLWNLNTHKTMVLELFYIYFYMLMFLNISLLILQTNFLSYFAYIISTTAIQLLLYLYRYNMFFIYKPNSHFKKYLHELSYFAKLSFGELPKMPIITLPIITKLYIQFYILILFHNQCKSELTLSNFYVSDGG